MFKFVKEKFKRIPKNLFQSFISLSILQIINYISPFITLPYILKTIGIEKFGLISFAFAVMTYFQIITDYGFNLSATRAIAVNRDNKHKIEEIFSSVMIIKFVLIFISMIILVFIIMFFPKFSENWEIYLLAFGAVIGNGLFPIWFFQGIEEMKYITLISIISKSIFTLSIFLFVHSEEDFLKIPILNSLGFIVTTFISLIIIKKKFSIKFRYVKPEKIKYYFLDSSSFFLSRVSVSIYTSSNTVILGFFSSNNMVGYYSLAERLYQGLQYIYFPLTQSLYPYMSASKNRNLFKKILKFVFILNVILVTILFLFADKILLLIFGNEINELSVATFRILLIASLIVVPSIMIGYPYLGAMGYSQYANKSVIVGSIFHLFGLGLLVLFDLINLYSIALMVIITELIVFLVRVYYVKMYIEVSK